MTTGVGASAGRPLGRSMSACSLGPSPSSMYSSCHVAPFGGSAARAAAGTSRASRQARTRNRCIGAATPPWFGTCADGQNPGMDDLGAPIAYLALDEGTPVYSSDDVRIGEVAHVLADDGADVFDGLVLKVQGGHRFVDAPEVAALHERGVLLSLDAAGCEQLPEPTENPGTFDVNPADAEESELTGKLRRAGDYISRPY